MFLRYYTRLSARLDYRIFTEHAEAIRNSNVEILHYFTLARGYGHRRVYLLQLWHTSLIASDNSGETED